MGPIEILQARNILFQFELEILQTSHPDIDFENATTVLFLITTCSRNPQLSPYKNGASNALCGIFDPSNNLALGRYLDHTAITVDGLPEVPLLVYPGPIRFSFSIILEEYSLIAEISCRNGIVECEDAFRARVDEVKGFVVR